jgi:MFS family permease
VRAGATVFGGICLVALLPLFARRELGLGSLGFGVLLGCMGLGAVLSAILLPKAGLSAEAALSSGTLGFAGAVCAVAVVHAPWLACALMGIAGFAWMAIMSSLNVAVQLATPAWVRARVLSAFMLVFQGSIALGGVVWGALATRTSLRTSLLAGGATMLASVVVRGWFPLTGRSPNFSPAAWPKPALVCDPPIDAGPILVTVSYRVAAENVRAFVRATHELERLRRRGGAYQWELFRDPSTPDAFLEVYYVEEWADHLRQHERATVEEGDLEKKLQSLVVAGTEREVSHLIAVSWDTDPEA